MHEKLLEIAKQAAEIVDNYEPGLVAFDNAKIILEQVRGMVSEVADPDAALAIADAVHSGLERVIFLEAEYAGSPSPR